MEKAEQIIQLLETMTKQLELLIEQHIQAREMFLKKNLVSELTRALTEIGSSGEVDKKQSEK